MILLDETLKEIKSLKSPNGNSATANTTKRTKENIILPMLFLRKRKNSLFFDFSIIFVKIYEQREYKKSKPRTHIKI